MGDDFDDFLNSGGRSGISILSKLQNRNMILEPYLQLYILFQGFRLYRSNHHHRSNIQNQRCNPGI